MVVRLRSVDAEVNSTIAGATGTEKSEREAPAELPTIVPNTTSTIASETSTPRSSPAPSPSRGTSRDERYEELLRAPTPQGARASKPAPAEKPTFLQRVATAIGLGDKPAPAPAAATPAASRPSRQPSQQQAQSQQPRPSSETPSKDPQKPAAERDPESDTTPPQLLGLNFNPPQVQDGETTVLNIQAQDDLSGVRTISGVIANPTGATVSGFAAQLEPDTNRYTARIVVPKDAAEGNWHIKYLTLADKASNSVNLAYGQGLAPMMATFRVTSSRSDARGPELKAIWVDRRGMAAGEKNTVFVQAEDDKAGVQLVSGVFVSPAKQARLGFGCRGTDTGTWECSLNVPECVDCGIWQLEQVQMQDKANNTTTARVDNQMVSQIQVDISGNRCDGAAPTLTSLALTPPVVSNQQANQIQVTAIVQDDTCGGATLSGLATGPQGQRLNIIFDPSKDGQHFTGRIEVSQNAAKGTYTIAWIQALDKGQNLRAYSANDPVVGRVTFQVE